MSEQVNINVNETNENINITSTEIVEVIDINVGETIEEVTLNITEEVIQVNINKVTGGGNQDLQSVTDNGNTTTNDIQVENANYFSIVQPSDVGTENKNTGAYTYIGADGVLGLKTANIESTLKNTNVVNSVTLEFPNKPTGIYTIATTEDTSTQVNSDWNATSGVAEILNKPFIPTNTSDLTNDSNFVSDANYVHTDNNFTNTLKTKLDGIADGAEVNVNADWNATSGDALILNKPTSLPPNGSASGDLQGSYPNPTVHQIQGQPVQNGNPANGDVLIWDNSQWKHQKLKTTDIQDNDGLHLITTAQQTIINNTSGTNTGDNAVNSLYSGLATSKQDTLVSGTNIKTINSNSLLGSGNVSVGTVTSVSALTLGTTGTDLSSSVATGTSTPVITLNVPNASATNRGALSSTDWSTFNNKQNASTRRNANNTTNNNINYCGVALGTGVSESSAVWTITRLTIAASGSITTAIATNVAWTNRQSATYI